jgi:hypothetical protein
MNEDIKISTQQLAAEEVIVPEAQPSGWLLFYRYPNTRAWSYGIPDYDGNRDTIRYPYPLFKTKDEAMNQARKSLPHGGDVKLFKIDL